MKPLYLRVFHRVVAVYKTLALVCGLHRVKGISLVKRQLLDFNNCQACKLTHVTEASPQKPPAKATDNGDTGELLP